MGKPNLFVEVIEAIREIDYINEHGTDTDRREARKHGREIQKILRRNINVIERLRKKREREK